MADAIDSRAIPRIIHWIWVGGPAPARFMAYREAWARHHPGWQIRVPNVKKIGVASSDSTSVSPGVPAPCGELLPVVLLPVRAVDASSAPRLDPPLLATANCVSPLVMAASGWRLSLRISNAASQAHTKRDNAGRQYA
ncbi:hypothetical protein ACQEVF_01085 [Nonomuraea polychroma]|uniref:hypothetical protein n=1 Tax=Nonomuraea polychroma TaxID=46176 RepID=UPI003D8FBAED